MILCFLTLLRVAIISTKFEDIQEKLPEIKISEEFRHLKYSFRNILKSKRLKSLLIFNSLMVAIIKILQNLRNTVLLEVRMPEQYFGVIFAFLGIISGIATKNQDKIHKKYKNRTLTFLAVPTTISCLFIGILLIFKLDTKISIPIILILFALQYIMKGPYYVLIKRYFNNFTNSEKRIKIATVNNLVENLIASILIFGTSFILNIIPANYTLIIVGTIFSISMILLLNYMKSTVGLRMEQYGKKEIL